jgi:RNA polymerase sigma factor (sigma-70 family)
MVRAVSSGSVDAWHQFLQRYSRLVYNVVQRHMFAEDEDDVRSVYVDVLKALFDGEIDGYRGESVLSTWLIVFTRHRTYDFIREQRGRYREPKNLDKLSEYDRNVLRWYIVERLPIEVVFQILDCYGFSPDAQNLIDSVLKIESVLDRRYLDRIDNEFQADKYNLDSARALKCFAQLKFEYDEKAGRIGITSYLEEKDADETMTRIREAISALSHEEQQIIYWRFERNWTAKEIAKELRIGGERRVYALIGKTIRKLRKSMLLEEKG